MRSLARIAAALAVALAACKGSGNGHLPEGAALLFDVRFAAPDDKPGSPPKVYEPGATQVFPSAIPSQVFMGQPTVVDALCGLTDQPVRLSAATGNMSHEGLEFLLSQRYARYHVEADLCVAQLGAPPRPASEPQLALFVDFPAAYAIGFYADGTIGLVDAEKTDPNAPPDRIGQWQKDEPVHVAIDTDFEKQIWTVALDGKRVHEGKFPGYLGRAARIVLRGNESNVAGFDNFVAWGERDLAAGLTEPPSGPKVGDE